MWRTCAPCGGQQWQDMLEVTQFPGIARRWITGRVDPCGSCGSMAAPILVEPAPCMALAPYGPPIPSPEDMLRVIGVL